MKSKEAQLMVLKEMKYEAFSVFIQIICYNKQ